MATVLSENPNETRGSARGKVDQHRFPLNETISSGTRLRFVKYDRFNPVDMAAETSTATINLPLPVNVPENYSILTTAHDMKAAGMINNSNAERAINANAGVDWSDLEAVAKLGISGATNAIRSGAFNATSALAGIGSMMGDDRQRTISAFTGIVQNPHTTVLFEGVSLRSINLEWRFSPRSEEETEALKSIYDTIKLRIHPEELALGYALNYPDLVYVEFTGKAEKYFPKFQKAMINNITITPDSSGGMPLYKSGAPVSYNFQISATETSIVTRNVLRDQMGMQQ